ncbi:hypothetical protein [Blastomonas fulva]|uniref:hypothetical protein n=1 Tax=Blastomonas fulva TaxID=1550728 RepID=UPI003F707314
MAVKISTGDKVHSLTSPPEKPEPYPPSDLIAQSIEYGDRTILVTVPFPDTIAIIAEIKNEHLESPYSTGGGVKKIYSAIDADMKKFVENLKKETLADPKPKVTGGANPKAVFNIAYSETEPLQRAHLSLMRKQGQDFGIWSARLEFSVSKATPSGLMQLTSAFENALPLLFEKMLPDFRVSRIDPAIDLIGIRPIDVIARIEKPGKRLVYVGDNGEPESLYLYQKKQPLKKPPASMAKRTTGPLRLKLYERRDYFRQLMLDPPYGDCPVTRVEAELVWDSKRPMLSSLPKLSNPFAGTHVAYAAKLVTSHTKPKDWLAFCLAAFGSGVRTAQEKWPKGIGLNFRSTYSSCPGDLVHPDCWDQWQDGLAYTGLNKWIAAGGS